MLKVFETLLPQARTLSKRSSILGSISRAALELDAVEIAYTLVESGRLKG